jgi:tetratricopeptide (TPR) repeat protein
MLFGLGFYAVTIFPMLKCFPIPYGNFISADRYMILPLVGLVIVLWSLVSKLPFVKKTVGGIAVALFSALLFFTSFHYSLTWKDSLSFYSGLIEKHPELRSAWGNRGRVYMAQEKFPEAIADYTELIHLDPGYSNAYLNRGLAYIRVNKDYNAFNDFSSAIQYDSGNYKAYNNRALLLLKQKQPEKALEDALKAVDIGYQDPDTWFNAALIYLSLEKYDDCLKSLDNAAKFNFRNKQLIEKMRAEAISKKTSTSGS